MPSVNIVPTEIFFVSNVQKKLLQETSHYTIYNIYILYYIYIIYILSIIYSVHYAIVHLGLNVSSSAHNCGCVVDGGNVWQRFEYIHIYNI